MKRLCVSEWGRLQIGPDKELTETEADTLERAAAASGRSVLAREGRSLRFRSIVGVLVAHGVQVEILPKIDDPETGNPDAVRPDLVRHVLVDMLARVWGFSAFGGARTGLATQRRTLLEVVAALFATHLLREVARGVSRRYVTEEEDLPRLRGRMDVGRQFTRLMASPQLIACRFDELSADTPLNRLLRCTVRHLAVRVRDPATTLTLHEIDARLDGVGRVAPAEALAAPLSRPNRLTARLVAFEAPARHFLQAIWQSTSLGDTVGFGLLFDMNELFEAFVGVEQVETPGPQPTARGSIAGGYLSNDGLRGRPHRACCTPTLPVRDIPREIGLATDLSQPRSEHLNLDSHTRALKSKLYKESAPGHSRRNDLRWDTMLNVYVSTR